MTHNEFVVFSLKTKKPKNFVSWEHHQYLQCFFALNTEHPLLLSPKSPIAYNESGSLVFRLNKFIATEIVNYFFLNIKENKPNFLLDFKTLLNNQGSDLSQKKIDIMYIKLTGFPPGLNPVKENDMRLINFFGFNKLKEYFGPLEPKYSYSDDLNSIERAIWKTELDSFIKENDMTLSKIFIEVLKVYFYLNREKIKESLPPQIKHLIIHCSARNKKKNSKGYTLLYDSNKSLKKFLQRKAKLKR